MSNPLNLEIHVQKDEADTELVANIYYRWGAYTLSSFDCVNSIYHALSDSFDKRSSYPSDMLWIADTLGAKESNFISGISEESLTYLSDNYDQQTSDMDLKLAQDGREGILALSEDDMSDTLLNSQGTAGVVIYQFFAEYPSLKERSE